MNKTTTVAVVRKPRKHLFWKILTISLSFLFLQLLLWSVMLKPQIYADVTWVPQSVFTSVKQTTCLLRMHQRPMAWFEATFFSSLAIFGYCCGCTGVVDNTAGLHVYGRTLPSFEYAMMGIHQKYYWMCFVPWIITFSQNWLQNVGEHLILFRGEIVYEAHNIFSCMTTVFLVSMVQLLLASEVVCMTVQGWRTMRNINNENRIWEQRKRLLGGDYLNTVFGM